MKMKKQVKEKKVGMAKKMQGQTEEKERVVKKSSAAGSRVTKATAKGKPQETTAQQIPSAAVSSGQVMPRVEGKLAARTQPGERSVVAVKAVEGNSPAEKSVIHKETAAGKVSASVGTAAAAHPKAAKEEPAPGICKQYSASHGLCKVTFRLPAAAAPAAKKVTIVGDFNGWDKETTLLKRQDNGDFAVTLDLDAGREYRFRYLIDGQRWENDWRADKYVRSPYGGDDSVVSV
jgi:hypothetical protein